MRMVRKFLHRLIWICSVPRLCLAFGGSGHDQQKGQLELSPRRELLRKEGRESDHSLQEASPAAFKEYRFTVSKTRQTGQSIFDISEIFLVDQAGEVIPLNTPNTVLSVSNSQVISHDPRNLVDNNPSTSIELSTDQSITVKLQDDGVLVSGFGFKTSQNQAMDPTSFSLEGSMDGNAWYLLSQKASYNTPDVRGALVGPFLVSKLAAVALQGSNKTLPPNAFPKSLASGAVAAISKAARRPFQAPASSLSTQSERKDAGAATLRATTLTSTLPVEAALPAAAPEVSTAVLDASKAAGLDDAETQATAAAVAAVESQGGQASIEERLKKAVMGAGLSAEQVGLVTAALRSVDPSHWSAVLSAWSAVAKKELPQSAGEKVAAVVSASGDAGFTVEEQAAASAQAAAAAAAAEEAVEAVAPSPLKMVGQALEGAELPPEGKAAVADAASKELPENQAAIADVLRAAGVMATTTLPQVDAIADPGAKLILKAVAQKLENATIDPVEKVSIANAAAEAYIKSMASTTSFDGIGALVRAAEEAGLSHAQVRRLAETAEHLTTAEQLAAATALRAASEGSEVLSPEDPATKVAAVVKAEAAAGVPEPEQAAAAAAAVTVAARKAKKAKLAEAEDQLLSDIVSQALKIGLDEDQAEAVLNVVSSMRPDEQAVIDEFLMSLLNPISVTTAPSTSPSLGVVTASPTVPAVPAAAVSTTAAAEALVVPGASAFTFHVVPSSSSRSTYQAETRLSAKGFVLGVALDVQGLVSFIESTTGREVDPYELSLAYGSFLFSWPSSEAGCSDDESGFTDFQSITFYNATFANPGQSCGDLLASTMDLDGVLRFPTEGDTDLFRLAGMFGKQYETSGGDLVTLSILDLLIFQIKPSGEKVEYRVCGDSSGASYLGCPTKSPLKIKYPENSLGQGVKICSGQSHFHEYKLENCFPV